MLLLFVVDKLCVLSTAGSTSSSETNTPAATPRREGGGAKGEGYKYGTLSRVRKFKVDGEVIESRTRRIVDMKANKTLRDNKKYQEMRYIYTTHNIVCTCLLSVLRLQVDHFDSSCTYIHLTQCMCTYRPWMNNEYTKLIICMCTIVNFFYDEELYALTKHGF